MVRPGPTTAPPGEGVGGLLVVPGVVHPGRVAGVEGADDDALTICALVVALGRAHRDVGRPAAAPRRAIRAWCRPRRRCATFRDWRRGRRCRRCGSSGSCSTLELVLLGHVRVRRDRHGSLRRGSARSRSWRARSRREGASALHSRTSGMRSSWCASLRESGGFAGAAAAVGAVRAAVALISASTASRRERIHAPRLHEVDRVARELVGHVGVDEVAHARIDLEHRRIAGRGHAPRRTG